MRVNQTGQGAGGEEEFSGSGPREGDFANLVCELRQLTIKLGELVGTALRLGEEIKGVLGILERKGLVPPEEIKRVHDELAAQLERRKPGRRNHRRRPTA